MTKIIAITVKTMALEKLLAERSENKTIAINKMGPNLWLRLISTSINIEKSFQSDRKIRPRRVYMRRVIGNVLWPWRIVNCRFLMSDTSLRNVVYVDSRNAEKHRKDRNQWEFDIPAN